jgi:ParB-like chromosome segregation protein Spo0J
MTVGSRASSACKARIKRLRIRHLPVASLKPNPQNLRVHSDKQICQIGECIRWVGVVVRILVDSKCRVIAGHGRLLACKRLGIELVPTIMLDSLSQAQVQAFMIADNRLAEIAPGTTVCWGSG